MFARLVLAPTTSPPRRPVDYCSESAFSIKCPFEIAVANQDSHSSELLIRCVHNLAVGFAVDLYFLPHQSNMPPMRPPVSNAFFCFASRLS